MTQTQVADPSDGLWTVKIMKFMALLFQQLTLMMENNELGEVEELCLNFILNMFLM
jgi:hypothetical protein